MTGFVSVGRARISAVRSRPGGAEAIRGGREWSAGRITPELARFHTMGPQKVFEVLAVEDDPAADPVVGQPSLADE